MGGVLWDLFEREAEKQACQAQEETKSAFVSPFPFQCKDKARVSVHFINL